MMGFFLPRGTEKVVKDPALQGFHTHTTNLMISRKLLILIMIKQE